MSFKPVVRRTAYGEFVRWQVLDTLERAGGLLSIQDLASYIGLKPTHNFRRQIETLACEGFIRRHFGYSESGRIFLLYGIAFKNTGDAEIPF